MSHKVLCICGKEIDISDEDIQLVFIRNKTTCLHLKEYLLPSYKDAYIQLSGMNPEDFDHRDFCVDVRFKNIPKNICRDNFCSCVRCWNQLYMGEVLNTDV